MYGDYGLRSLAHIVIGWFLQIGYLDRVSSPFQAHDNRVKRFWER